MVGVQKLTIMQDQIMDLVDRRLLSKLDPHQGTFQVQIKINAVSSARG